MAESNQIIRFGDGLVDAAKSVKIDPAEFINVDTSQTAIRYKKMAPIVIASRLKTMCDDCEDQEAKKKLRALTAELETAQQYGIDVGKSELIYLASIQSQNTVRACLGVYNLYSLNGKPVCDFAMIDIIQKRTIDRSNVGLVWTTTAIALGAFLPVFGPLLALGGVITALTSARESIKNMTTKDQADILMLKTLEHYGLIRLLGNNQIQVVND